MIKMTIWSLICVGAGVVLGRVPLDGKTAVDRAEQQWQHDKLSEKVESAVRDAKHVIGRDGPTETHTKEDRAAIDRLITQH